MLLRRMLSLRLRTVMMDTKSIESGKKKNKTKKDDANPVTNYVNIRLVENRKKSQHQQSWMKTDTRSIGFGTLNWRR